MIIFQNQQMCLKYSFFHIFISPYLQSQQSFDIIIIRKQITLSHNNRTMKSVKEFIRNYKLSTSRQNHLISQTHKITNYQEPKSIISPPKNYSSPQYRTSRNNFAINNTNRKISLPPIIQCKKINPFDLQSKKNQVIFKFLKAKNQEYSISKCQSQRSHTQIGVKKNKEKITNRSNISINLQQIRMKPVDKYFYKLDNIRLAQRLLIAKPSPQLQRASHKKFYEKQNHYKLQISKNYLSPKKNKIKYKNKQRKQWLQ